MRNVLKFENIKYLLRLIVKVKHSPRRHPFQVYISVFILLKWGAFPKCLFIRPEIERCNTMYYIHYTCNLRSLLGKLEETSDSCEFHCMLDFHWFIQTMEMSRIKTPATWLSPQLFLHFNFDLSRVACFRTASQGEQRLCLWGLPDSEKTVMLKQ